MEKLSFVQQNRASEILGNLSVAWFSGGIITPLIIQSISLIEYFIFFVLSLLISGSLFIFSLEIIKKKSLKI